MKDEAINPIPGMVMVMIAVVVIVIASILFAVNPFTGAFDILVIILALLSLKGLVMLEPGEAAAFLYFGNYAGTLKRDGISWVNPLFSVNKVSLRLKNFESAKLKVNDSEGNPIEIGAVVSWRIVSVGEALFNVDDVDDFVRVQSETALRDLANHHPYEGRDDKEISLRGKGDKVAELLKVRVQEHLKAAGVQVNDARLSHLAYAPEIAQVMLQRQQATAVVAARQRIVEGAVGMVEMALKQLSKKKLASLKPDRKAALVSNLLIVLCSERGAQPTMPVNTES